MKREINFFSDGDSSISNAHPSASEPRSNSPSQTAESQHCGGNYMMTRQTHNITTRSPQEPFSRSPPEVGIIWRETELFSYPVLGIRQSEPAFGAPPALTLEMYFEGRAAARFADDDASFISVWNGVRIVRSYPIPSGGDELDGDMGTRLTTRNFLGALEQPLMTVTDPIVELDHEELDLDLRL